jgi:predicted MFS family arabinose efflux permease
LGQALWPWIVVSPLGGALTDAFSWRAAHALPAALALTALAGACRGKLGAGAIVPGPRSGLLGVVADRRARRWLAAELAAWFAWAAELTYGGAFLIERHSLSETVVGVLFAFAAAAFFLGSVHAPRLVPRIARRRVIITAVLAMAVLIPLQLQTARSVWVGFAFLCAAALCSGIRASTAAGLGLAQMPRGPGAIMAAQPAVIQLGYLFGAFVGARILGSTDYAGLGLVLGGALVASAIVTTTSGDPLTERQERAPTGADETKYVFRAGAQVPAGSRVAWGRRSMSAGAARREDPSAPVCRRCGTTPVGGGLRRSSTAVRLPTSARVVPCSTWRGRRQSLR